MVEKNCAFDQAKNSLYCCRIIVACDNNNRPQTDYLWYRLLPEERMLLPVIAEGGKNEGMLLSHFEIEEIYRYCRFPYKCERIPASLKSLMDSDILESVLDCKLRLSSRQDCGLKSGIRL
jgi:hypothetical protein